MIWTLLIGAALAGCGDAEREDALDGRADAAAELPGGMTDETAAADASPAAREPESAPGAEPPTTSQQAGQRAFEGTAGVTDRPRPGVGVASLRVVETATHEGFDRVVFEFRGDTLPGYHIEYVDRPVRQCGSGDPVDLPASRGGQPLVVRLEPARAHTDQGEPTIQDRARKPLLPVLKELRLICDFEAQVAWVLGLAEPNRYRVLELRDPARIVVDVAH